MDHVECETIQQFEIEMGDIVDAVEPVRQARPAKAGVRGHDQTAPRRKQRDRIVQVRELPPEGIHGGTAAFAARVDWRSSRLAPDV